MADSTVAVAAFQAEEEAVGLMVEEEAVELRPEEAVVELPEAAVVELPRAAGRTSRRLVRVALRTSAPMP